MVTKMIRAEHITTYDHVVTGGEHNPLNEGGKRRAWKVAEVVVSGGRTRLRMVLRGGDSRGQDAWLEHSCENRTKLRVKNGGDQLKMEMK